MLCGVDLRDHQVALRVQFRRVEIDDRRAFLQHVALGRENFCDPPAVARADVRLVHLDGSRDRLAAAAAACGEQRDGNREDSEKCAALILHGDKLFAQPSQKPM